jgi:DNA polymerase-3 subunit epsilon
VIKLFNMQWDEVPTCWLDVETTGTVPGVDAAVQVALVRFEGGGVVARYSALVNPRRLIPAEATGIHNITDKMVSDAPPIDDVFGKSEVQALLAGAQCGAFNAEFDRRFIPCWALNLEHKEGWRWPWYDSLSWVRLVDRFARGKGRHKLSAACERRGIELTNAHDAASDAEAAGRLFYRVVPEALKHGLMSVGEVLGRQREADNAEWFRFMEFLASAPPLEARP